MHHLRLMIATRFIAPALLFACTVAPPSDSGPMADSGADTGDDTAAPTEVRISYAFVPPDRDCRGGVRDAAYPAWDWPPAGSDCEFMGSVVEMVDLNGVLIRFGNECVPQSDRWVVRGATEAEIIRLSGDPSWPRCEDLPGYPWPGYPPHTAVP